jgi:hypothetical protein
VQEQLDILQTIKVTEIQVILAALVQQALQLQVAVRALVIQLILHYSQVDQVAVDQVAALVFIQVVTALQGKDILVDGDTTKVDQAVALEIKLLAHLLFVCTEVVEVVELENRDLIVKDCTMKLKVATASHQVLQELL